MDALQGFAYVREVKNNPVLPGAHRGEGNHMNGEEIYFSFANISESRFFTVVYFFSGMGKVVPFINVK